MLTGLRLRSRAKRLTVGGGGNPPAIFAGALPIGTSNYAIPGSGTVKYVAPAASGGSNSNAGTLAAPYLTMAHAVSQIAATGTIIMRAGTYHEGNLTSGVQISSAKNITIQAYPNEAVWFDGSSTYSSWVNNGNGTWTATYTLTLARIDLTGFPGVDPYRGHTDQVWVDNVALAQIADNTTPAAGQFSVNQTADTLTIGTDPAGKTVRVADLSACLEISGVTNLKGLGFRRYSPQMKETFSAFAYYGGSSAGSLIENCYFQESGMAGLNVTKPDIIVRSNTFQDCNQMGCGCTTPDRLLFEKNLLRRLNLGLWDQAPVGGGIKVTRSDEVIIRWNWFEDMPDYNQIWFDQSCTRTYIYGNYVDGRDKGRGPSYRCIFQEISDGGFISGVQYRNYIVGNDTIGGTYSLQNTGSGYSDWWNNRTLAHNTAGLNFGEDRYWPGGPGETGGKPQSMTPWLTRHCQVINNDLGYNVAGTGGIQIIAYSDFTGTTTDEVLGWDMFDLIAGNWFRTAPPGSMSQFGKADGNRNSYNTLAALAASGADVGGPPGAKLGTNFQGASATGIADQWTGNGIAEGTAITSGNVATTGNFTGSGVTWTRNVSAPTFTLTTAGDGFLITNTATTDIVRLDAVLTTSVTALKAQVKFTAPPSTTGVTELLIVRNATSTQTYVRYDSATRTFMLRDNNNSTNYGVTPAITAGDTVLIDLVCALSAAPTTSNGRMFYRVRNLTAPTWNTTGYYFFDSLYNRNLGTANFTIVRWGKTGGDSTVLTTGEKFEYLGVEGATVNPADTSEAAASAYFAAAPATGGGPDPATYAVATTATVAGMLGVPTGTKMIGPNPDNLPVVMPGA